MNARLKKENKCCRRRVDTQIQANDIVYQLLNGKIRSREKPNSV